jgi:flagellar motor switch protein FliN/FliY
MSNTDVKNEKLDELNKMKDGTDDLDSFLSDDVSEGQAPAAKKGSIGLLKNIPVRLTLEVDSADVTIGDLLSAEPGEVIALDKRVGEPLDVKANGELFARAEVVVVDGRYGMRLLEIVDSGVIAEANTTT